MPLAKIQCTKEITNETLQSISDIIKDITGKTLSELKDTSNVVFLNFIKNKLDKDSL